MATKLRQTGIAPIGEMPWGTHFSLFYETKADLRDTVASYFSAGLIAGELCVWMPSDTKMERAVMQRLRRDVPNCERQLAKGAVQFIGADKWYRETGRFSEAIVMRKWREQLDRASDEGFAGVRGSGDLAWLTRKDWRAFMKYEEGLQRFLRNRPALVLCTYVLGKMRAADILDVARCHDFAAARRHTRWDIVETPTLKRTKEQIQRANEELRSRIEEQAIQLSRVKRSVREREQEARFEATLEERTRLARELHDSLLQSVTGIGLQLRAALPRLVTDRDSAIRAIGHIADLADATVRDARRAVWDIRSPSLVEKGLVRSLEDAVRKLSNHAKVGFQVDGAPHDLPPALQDTIYRVGQEAITNAMKHARPRHVTVTLAYLPKAVRLTVLDDGRGFDTERAFRSYEGKWGLLGMRERVERIGASLSVRSMLGRGTKVDLRIPVPALVPVSAPESTSKVVLPAASAKRVIRYADSSTHRGRPSHSAHRGSGADRQRKRPGARRRGG